MELVLTRSDAAPVLDAIQDWQHAIQLVPSSSGFEHRPVDQINSNRADPISDNSKFAGMGIGFRFFVHIRVSLQGKLVRPGLLTPALVAPGCQLSHA